MRIQIDLRACAACAFLCAIVMGHPVCAAIINVPADFATIQEAIVAAVDGDEIIVATGTYSEAIDFLGKAITVRSTDPSDLAVVQATIIDGTDFDHVVKCVTGEGLDTVLSGFVITGGNADGGDEDSHGGGMYNFDSSPSVSNCSYSGNSASTPGGTGGGMFNDGSSPMVSNCSFSGNTAIDSGGGMYTFGSSPTVTNCLFSGNSVSWRGGGMDNSVGSPTVADCLFSGNTGTKLGGGMYNTGISSATVTGCSFSGNTAPEGGGMYNGSST